ncbi:MAG: lysine exporter protein LysE/YggA [Osedax symbiont Rs2]|nr:MAG: lysine exporter protein LysE/YggA [Osedax symbiont Rs2]
MLSIEFIITSLIVVLIPGTGVIYTISTGLFKGSRASIFAALGCTAGIIPSLGACVLGLAAIMHTSAVVFQLVKFAGVAYLLYLAWGMWKDTSALVIEAEGSRGNLWAISVKGFFINILNPKLSLFFLAFLPQFIPLDAAAPLINMLVLGSVFMGMTFLVFVIYGLLANSLSHYVVNSPKVIKYIQRSFAASFALLGAKLAFADR